MEKKKTHYLPVRAKSTHGWMKPLGSSPPQTSRKWWTGAGVTYKLPHRCGHWCCRRGERRRRVGGAGEGSEGGVPGFFSLPKIYATLLPLARLPRRTWPGEMYAHVHKLVPCPSATRRLSGLKTFKVSPRSATASVRGPVEELLARLQRHLCNSLQRLSKHNAGGRDVVQVLTYFWASDASKMLHHNKKKERFSKVGFYSDIIKKSLNVYWCLSVHFESERRGSNSFATAAPFQKRPFSFNPFITNTHPFSEISPLF